MKANSVSSSSATCITYHHGTSAGIQAAMDETGQQEHFVHGHWQRSIAISGWKTHARVVQPHRSCKMSLDGRYELIFAAGSNVPKLVYSPVFFERCRLQGHTTFIQS